MLDDADLTGCIYYLQFNMTLMCYVLNPGTLLSSLTFCVTKHACVRVRQEAQQWETERCFVQHHWSASSDSSWQHLMTGKRGIFGLIFWAGLQSEAWTKGKGKSFGFFPCYVIACRVNSLQSSKPFQLEILMFASINSLN